MIGNLRVGGVHQTRSDKRSSKVSSLSDKSSDLAHGLSRRIQASLEVKVLNEPAGAKNSEDLQVGQRIGDGFGGW